MPFDFQAEDDVGFQGITSSSMTAVETPSTLIFDGLIDRDDHRFADASLDDLIQVVAAGHEVPDDRPGPTSARPPRRMIASIWSVGHAATVGPVRHHGVARVGDRQHPSQERDGLAGKAIGVPFAIEPLVVAAHSGPEVAQLPDVGDHPVPDDRMLLDMGHLLGVELDPGFSRMSSRTPILPMSCSRPAR